MSKLAVLILVLIAFPVRAQKALLSEKEQRKMVTADQWMADKNYGKASEVYRELLELNESNVYLKLKLAEACVALHNLREAKDWYQQVFGKKGREIPVDAQPVHIYQYAGILLSDENTEEALYWYEQYRQRNPADTRTTRKIEGIKNRNNLQKTAPGYEIGATSLNSKYPDFSPSFYDKGLVFVSGRSMADAKGGDDVQTAFLDLYYSELRPDGSLSEVKKFSEAINTSANEGPSIFYGVDRSMIFTRNNLKGKQRAEDESIIVQLQLFSSDMDTTTQTWKKPTLLPINSDQYSIGHPAISSNGQHLYFSSNMPGSYGDTDLYVSDKVNGKWTAPKNLGPMVNTEGSEMFPFIHGDSVLYFASDGHSGLGGLDIYRFSLRTQKLENVGAPINSGRDDFGLILDASGQNGYFSSGRNETGADKNDDIFYVRKKKPVEKPEPVVEPVVVAQPEEVIAEKEIYYTIQILAVRSRKMVKKSFLQNLKGVLKYEGRDGLYRYTYGRYDNREEAIVALDEIKRNGYSDAFLRREETYKDLSDRPGVMVDRLYH